MSEHRRAHAIADARAALEELRRLREKGVEWKELREAYFPNGALSENMLRDYVSEKRHFAGKRGRTIDAFATAWSLIQRSQCDRCNFYETMARRLQAGAGSQSPMHLPDRYFGRYLSFNRSIGEQPYSTPLEKTHRLSLHNVAIERCAACGRPVFKVLQKQPAIWREGAVFHFEDRIHIVIVDARYMPHAIVRPVADLDQKPLSGIALFDEEDASPNVSARRIAFVKAGSTLAGAEDLWQRMDRMLVGDKPRFEGALTGWSTE